MDPEQLRLRRRRHLADLVEEDGAAVRRLEQAGLGRLGAGERAALVAEQLALEQALGRPPQLRQRNGLPARFEPRWIGLGEDLLADAGLAEDEDVDIAARRLLRDPVDLAHAPIDDDHAGR